MKQCPNPNCILYTRLEELPDAYLKCPGCGGQLVDATLSTGALKSGHLTGAGSLMPPGGYSEQYEDDYDDAFAPPEPPVPRFTPYPQPPSMRPAQQAAPAPVQAPGSQQVNAQYADAEYYPFEQAEQQADPAVQVQAAPISLWTRIAFLGGAFLLVFACVLFAYVLVTRVFQRPAAVLTVQATETAVSSLKPPVNTPIAVMPTVPSSETLATPTRGDVAAVAATSTPQPVVVAPSPTPVLPPPATAVPPTPTDVLPPPATSAPVPPTQAPPPVQPAAPTAPPAQQQPAGGIIDAHMAQEVTPGSWGGNVGAYNPADPFMVAVQARYGPGGVESVVTRWYGPDDALLYELPRQFAQAGTYYSGFTLRKSTPWLPGEYRVDIHANGSASPSYTVRFSVVP